MQMLAGAGRPAAVAEASWTEHLRVTDLSVGTYWIPAGGTDEQEPHTEDEVYLVTAGLAVLESAGGRLQVHPGAVVYVPAGEPHRFTEITEDLTAVVVFGPAEYSRTETG